MPYWFIFLMYNVQSATSVRLWHWFMIGQFPVATNLLHLDIFLLCRFVDKFYMTVVFSLITLTSCTSIYCKYQLTFLGIFWLLHDNYHDIHYSKRQLVQTVFGEAGLFLFLGKWERWVMCIITWNDCNCVYMHHSFMTQTWACECTIVYYIFVLFVYYYVFILSNLATHW
jgi:hypothetical protein